MKVIDSHVHLDMNNKNPFKHIQDAFLNKDFLGCVLILNTQKEKEYFINNYDTFYKYKDKIHIAAALDVHHIEESKQFYDFLINNNINFSIKLHSIMHNITKNDFKKIYNFLLNINFKSIIVDAFYYGSNLKSLIMLELGIYLAKNFSHTNIIFAHFGGYKILELMLCSRELENIFYDTSFTQNYLFETSVFLDLKHCIKFSANRVMFGSDSPSFSLDEAYESSKKIVNDISLTKENLDAFYFKNAMKIYGLENINYEQK